MPTTQTIPIDLNTRGANPVAFTHQGDTARSFVFEVYNNGEAFSLTGYTAKIAAMLPADNGYHVIAGENMATCTISDNTITATLPAEFSAKPGNGVLTIILTGSGASIRPINVDFRIQKSADAPETIAGASDFVPVLQRYMAEDMQTYINAWLDAHPEAMQYYISGSKLVLDENGILSIQNDTDEIVEALDLDTLRTEVTDLKSDLSNNGLDVSINANKVSGLNCTTNATSYVTASNYETYYVPMITGATYDITIETTMAGCRLSHSESIPANGVSCVFDLESPISGSVSLSYTATTSGYLSVSLYKNASTVINITENKNTGVIQDIKNDIFGIDVTVNVAVGKFNIVVNGTSYVTSNGHRTAYLQVEKGKQYTISITSGTTNAPFRVAESNSPPSNGIPATFIEEINVTGTENYIYTATTDKYISFSCYNTAFSSVTAMVDSIAERVDALEEHFPRVSKYFTGAYLNTQKQGYNVNNNSFNPIQPTTSFEIPQDIAYYNNTLFTAFNGVKEIMMQNMETGERIASVQNNDIGHANCIMFSNEFYSSSDQYPMLYVSPEDGGYLRVFRITNDALTLQKTFLVDTTVTGYYTNFYLDPLNGLVYTLGYTENSYDSNASGNNNVIMCCFDIKSTTTDVDGNLIPTMVYKRFLPFILTHQGATFFNNRLFVVSSDYTQHNTNIYVISTDGTITNIISDFDSNVKDKECEGATFFEQDGEYKMLLLTGDNVLHVVSFAQ